MPTTRHEMQPFRRKRRSSVKNWGKIAIFNVRRNPFARNEVRSAKTEVKFASLGCRNPFARNASLGCRSQPIRTKWGAIGKNWGKLAIFNVPSQPFRTKRCSVVWYCCCVSLSMCVWFTVCVCLYSVCASTSDVRAPKTEVKLRCSMFSCVYCFCVSLFMCVCACVCVCVTVFGYVCVHLCLLPDVFVGLYLSASVYACLGLVFACDSLFLALSFCLISASNLTYHLYYFLSLLSPFCSSPHLLSVHQLNQDQYVHNCSIMLYF